MDQEGPRSTHKGRKLQSYTAVFKLNVIAFAKAYNSTKAAKTFAVDQRVSEW